MIRAALKVIYKILSKLSNLISPTINLGEVTVAYPKNTINLLLLLKRELSILYLFMKP